MKNTTVWHPVGQKLPGARRNEKMILNQLRLFGPFMKTRDMYVDALTLENNGVDVGTNALAA